MLPRVLHLVKFAFVLYSKSMLHFITSNQDKIRAANLHLQPLGIDFATQTHEFIEIQSQNPEEIARDKAEKAFLQLKTPLFVTDDSWYITTLRGFPGAYMKDVNKWLKPEDFLHLMQPYDNREVILHQALCFIDEHETHIFSQDLTGTILREKQGKNDTIFSVVSFSSTGKSIEECLRENIPVANDNAMWSEFGKWYLSGHEAR